MASDQGSSSQPCLPESTLKDTKSVRLLLGQHPQRRPWEGKSVAHYLLYFWELLPDPFTSLNSITTALSVEIAIHTENSLPSKSFFLVLHVGGTATGNHDSYSCVAFIAIGRIKLADSNAEIRQ